MYRFLKVMIENGETVTELPMPLWQLMSDDTVRTESLKEKARMCVQKLTLSEKLTQDSRKSVNYDDLLESGTGSLARDNSGDDGVFDEAKAEFLNEQLTRIPLPGISNMDQMRLMGVLDTLVQVRHTELFDCP